MTFLITNLTANKNYWSYFLDARIKLMRIVLAPIELLGVLLPFSLMIVYTQTFCWSHRFDEYHFNVYFQELVGKHTIIWIVICTFYLRDIGCILQAYIFTLLSALFLVLQ
jgi:F-type H+-transporting ATPase subunit a